MGDPARQRKLFIQCLAVVLCVLLFAALEVGAWLIARHRFPHVQRALPQGIRMVIPDEETIWAYPPHHGFSYEVAGVHEPINSRTNSLGVHDSEWSAARLASAMRLLAVGDSFTFGWGMPSLNDTFWRTLAKKLSSPEAGVTKTWEAFGLGYWMATFDQHVLHLRRHIRRVRPNVVLWGIFPGHLITILPHRHFLSHDGGLVRVTDPTVTIYDNRLAYSIDGHAYYSPLHIPYIITLPRRFFSEWYFLRHDYELVTLRNRVSYGV